MSIALTHANKKLVKTLLRVGRWGNESEIVRYGLHLVAREVEQEQQRSLAPVSRGVLGRAYGKSGSEDIKEARAFAKNSSHSAFAAKAGRRPKRNASELRKEARALLSEPGSKVDTVALLRTLRQ